MFEIRNHEAHFEAPGRPLHAPLGNHSAETKALAGRHGAGGNLGGIEKEGHVLAEGAQGQPSGDAHAGDDAEYKGHSLLPRSHVCSPRIARRARASSRDLASSRRAQTMFRTMTPKVSP